MSIEKDVFRKSTSRLGTSCRISDRAFLMETSSLSAVGMGKYGPKRGQGLKACTGTVFRPKRTVDAAVPRMSMRMFGYTYTDLSGLSKVSAFISFQTEHRVVL